MNDRAIISVAPDLVFRRASQNKWSSGPRDFAAEDTGDSNEKLVLSLLLKNMPTWIISAKQTRRHDRHDVNGVDILIHTHRGLLGLQVKTTAKKATVFRKRARETDTLRWIGVVCVNSRSGFALDDDKIAEQIASELTRIRNEQLR